MTGCTCIDELIAALHELETIFKDEWDENRNSQSKTLRDDAREASGFSMLMSAMADTLEDRKCRREEAARLEDKELAQKLKNPSPLILEAAARLRAKLEAK